MCRTACFFRQPVCTIIPPQPQSAVSHPVTHARSTNHIHATNHKHATKRKPPTAGTFTTSLIFPQPGFSVARTYFFQAVQAFYTFVWSLDSCCSCVKTKKRKSFRTKRHPEYPTFSLDPLNISPPIYFSRYIFRYA